MNFKFSIVLLFFVLVFSQCSKEKYKQAGLLSLKSFGSNPGNLAAYYYEPENATSNMPLVVVLHGCTQNAKDVAELSDWNKLADTYGFYVLYPEQKAINNISNCFNWFQAEDFNKNSGENASIKNMILEMQSKFGTNNYKTSITGLSAGGAMSMVMVSVYPDMFHAGAIMSGGPYKAATNTFASIGAMAGNVSKTPQEWGELVKTQNTSYVGDYCKLAIFHGKDDNVVDFKNAQEIVKQWTNVTESDLTNGTETLTFDGTADIKRIDYSNMYNVLKVSKFEISNMGHALAINPGSGEKEGGKTGTYGKDKDFFSSYWAAEFFDLIP